MLTGRHEVQVRTITVDSNGMEKRRYKRRYTRFGRHIFAIGSNEQTARLCGIAVNRAKLWIYILGGAFSGIAGVLMFSNENGTGDPTTSKNTPIRTRTEIT